MNHTEILHWCSANIQSGKVVEFPDELFSSLDGEISTEIARSFGSQTLMKLPMREQEFFAWLKEHDPEVWNDLWLNAPDEPYVVSLAFLPAFLDPSRGFPICDLESVDNYFFVPSLVQGENAADFIEGVRERFIAKHKLTVEQLLALECSLSPIDVWHFAWHHSVDLQRSKEAVQHLVDDQILVHLHTAAEIAEYIE